MVEVLVIMENPMEDRIQNENGLEYDIHATDSPLFAFNYIIRNQPDIIVLQMNGENLDGKMIYERIRNIQASKTIPVILMMDSEQMSEMAVYGNKYKTELMPTTTAKPAILEKIAELTHAVKRSEQKMVLAVDDNMIVLETVKLYLGNLYQVVTVQSAEKCLKFLEVNHPDLIIMDIAMPEMDGKEAFQKIQHMPNCQDIPILFQTGMATMENVKECLKLGPAGYIVKPIQKKGLINKVESILNGQAQKCIVILENAAVMRSSICKMLEHHYITVTVEQPAGLPEVMDGRNVDAIIVDIDNIVLDTSVLQKLVGEIPLVLLGNTMPEHAWETLKNPRNTFIPFPLEKERFMSEIRKAVYGDDEMEPLLEEQEELQEEEIEEQE